MPSLAACRYKDVHTFPKGISVKVNAIAWLVFGLTYNDVPAQHVSQYTTETFFAVLLQVQFYRMNFEFFLPHQLLPVVREDIYPTRKLDSSNERHKKTKLAITASLTYRVFITVVKELLVSFYLLYSLEPKGNKPIY